VTDQKMTTLERVAQNKASPSDIKSLKCSSTADNELQYNLIMEEQFALHSAHNRFPLGCSFDLGSKYMAPIVAAMQEAVNIVCFDLLDVLDANSVEGALVEFGVAQGGWLAPMLSHMERTGNIRTVVGFDSFEGLSEPNYAYDYSFWQKGQIAFPIEAAEQFLKASERPHLRLVKGWVSETLKQPLAESVLKVAFAKVDVDLYEPSVDCLEYLRDRLADGAILFFDDWCYDPNIGESKAFFDWCKSVPHYRFELIGFINWRMILRVHHVK
jgi:Macrocin-O-methyltransferase (TylF)